MKGIKELLDFVAWIFTVLFQIVGGLIAGYIMFAKGYGNLVYMWFGMTISVFLVGSLAILFRPAITPKNYILRFGLVAAGTALPLIVFYFSPLFFYNADYETPPEFPILATIAGVVCFYSLGKLTTKLRSLKTVKVASYGSSILVFLVGMYALWDWYSPVSLPIKRLGPYEALNMELVNIVGEGFSFDIINGDYVYGTSGQRLVILDISDPSHIFMAGQSDVIHDDFWRLNLYKDYIYMTSGSFGVEEENKIGIVDVSDPAKPHYLGSQDLSGKYIWDVEIVDHYLYIVGCLECSQYFPHDQNVLYILDLSNPQQPREVGHYLSAANINDVAILGDYAYLALNQEEVEHPGLLVLDVSNPQAPKEVGTFFESSKGYSVTVSENRLYFESGNSTSESGLHIMDISLPEFPQEIGFYQSSTCGQLTILPENLAYLRSYTSCSCNPCDIPKPISVSIIDFSDPQMPQQSEIKEFGDYLDLIDIEGGKAFTWDQSGRFYSLYNITDLEKPVEIGNYKVPFFSLYDLTGEIFMEDSKGVIPTEEMDLYILDFSNQIAPILSNTYNVDDYYWVEEFNKDHVYLSVDDEIQVLDISDPKKPVIVWRYDASSEFVGVAVRGKYAYLTYEVDGLFVYDVSDPASPVLINHQPELNGFRDIDGFDSSGRYFFSFDRDKIRVFDALDPLKIIEVDSFNKDGYHETTIVDDLAFLDDSMFNGPEPSTLLIFNLSNPQKIDKAAFWGWSYYSKVAGVSKEKVFIASLFDGVHLVDFSNPKDPQELAFYGIEDGTSGLAIGQDNLIYLISENNDLYVIRYIPPVP